MNETNLAQPMEASAESRLDERVERIRQIDREVAQLQQERNGLGEEVEKLREVMIRKSEEARSVVVGEYDRNTSSINGRY